MAERGISVADVRHALESGENILSYPDDKPFPSRLILARHGRRAIHVLAAEDKERGETIIITVYEPDPNLWNNQFRGRRRS